MWLVKNKKVSNQDYLQMDDDLVNEFAVYAEDDGEEIDASQYY